MSKKNGFQNFVIMPTSRKFKKNCCPNDTETQRVLHHGIMVPNNLKLHHIKKKTPMSSWYDFD